ncbi:2830_t:CDS:1, partial [Entrophospora sp. SA101]
MSHKYLDVGILDSPIYVQFTIFGNLDINWTVQYANVQIATAPIGFGLDNWTRQIQLEINWTYKNANTAYI